MAKITCSVCHQHHTIPNSEITFYGCGCGSIITKNNETLKNPKGHEITKTTPRILKKGQKGVYKSERFELIGYVSFWTHESFITYWTVQFENKKISTLVENAASFGWLEPYTSIDPKEYDPVFFKKIKPGKQFSLTDNHIQQADKKNNILFQVFDGAIAIPFSDTQHIVCTHQPCIKGNYEIWVNASDVTFFTYQNVDFEKLNIDNLSAPAFGETEYSTCLCNKCNTSQQVRHFPRVQTISCKNCSAQYYFDTFQLTWKNLNTTAQVKKNRAVQFIPIGTIVRLQEKDFEITGYIIKKNTYNEEWTEYQLFEVEKGVFKILTDYNGHYILSHEIQDTPVYYSSNLYDKIKYKDKTYRFIFKYGVHFLQFKGNLYGAYTNKNGYTIAHEFINPPEMYSLEFESNNNRYWYKAEHVPDNEINKIYKTLNKTKPYRIGFGTIRPSSKFPVKDIVIMCFLMATLYLGVHYYLIKDREPVPVKKSNFYLTSGNTHFEIDSIQIDQDKSSLNLINTTNLFNSWVSLDYTLINKSNGNEYYGNQDVSYFEGQDQDGSWKEGSNKSAYTFSGLKKGEYKLVGDAYFDPLEFRPNVVLSSTLVKSTHLGKNFWLPLILILGWGIFWIAKYFYIENARYSE